MEFKEKRRPGDTPRSHLHKLNYMYANNLTFRQYTTPSIRNSPITQQLGNHLQNDCPGKNALPINWSDVQDQMIPDALEVGQNQNAQGGKGSSGSAGRVGDWRMGWGEVMGVLGVVVIGFGRRF